MLENENLNEPQKPQLNIGAVSGSFFKCKADDYSSYEKGKIYHKDSIGKYLIENTKDWISVLDYPTSKELLECFENGTNKAKIVKSLKQWQNYR
jgi:hypothetical protein